MPMPNDYTVPVPDISGPLSQITDAIDKRRERKRLSEIGGMIQSGNLSGAAGAAFGGGDLRTGLAVKGMDDERKNKIAGILGNAAAQADTPEKWSQFVGVLGQRFPGADLSPYADFSSRDAVMAEFPQAAPEFKSISAGGSLYDPRTGKIVATAPQKQGGGISFSQNPDGTINFSVGGNNTQLTGPTKNTVQGKAINMSEMGSRISGVMEQFKPEYLTLGNRVGNLIQSGKAKLNPDMLDDNEKAALADYSKFRSTAIGNVNRLLNELSGAAVSPAEGERLKAEVPNPGTGIFDGDDPITFQAKAEAVLQSANAALARLKFYELAGTPSNLEEIPLNAVKNIGKEWFINVDGEWIGIGGL